MWLNTEIDVVDRLIVDSCITPSPPPPPPLHTNTHKMLAVPVVSAIDRFKHTYWPFCMTLYILRTIVLTRPLPFVYRKWPGDEATIIFKSFKRQYLFPISFLQPVVISSFSGFKNGLSLYPQVKSYISTSL